MLHTREHMLECRLVKPDGEHPRQHPYGILQLNDLLDGETRNCQRTIASTVSLDYHPRQTINSRPS